MTDHKADAERILEEVPTNPTSTGTTAAVVAATKAIFYLAEQQRIANLIEVAKWNDAALIRGDARSTTGQDVDLDVERARVDHVFRLVREGLGIADV